MPASQGHFEIVTTMSTFDSQNARSTSGPMTAVLSSGTILPVPEDMPGSLESATTEKSEPGDNDQNQQGELLRSDPQGQAMAQAHATHSTSNPNDNCLSNKDGDEVRADSVSIKQESPQPDPATLQLLSPLPSIPRQRLTCCRVGGRNILNLQPLPVDGVPVIPTSRTMLVRVNGYEARVVVNFKPGQPIPAPGALWESALRVAASVVGTEPTEEL